MGTTLSKAPTGMKKIRQQQNNFVNMGITSKWQYDTKKKSNYIMGTDSGFQYSWGPFLHSPQVFILCGLQKTLAQTLVQIAGIHSDLLLKTTMCC